MYDSVIVALDLSNASKSVFTKALSLAKADGASLILLHVLSSEEPTSHFLAGYMSHPRNHAIHVPSEIVQQANQAFQREWQEFEQNGLEMLNLFAKRAIAAGVKTEFSQITGHPSSTICEFARSAHADLIVIGRRGHSRLQEMMLGSVSNYVIHHAPCSILLVQTPILAESTSTDQIQNMVCV